MEKRRPHYDLTAVRAVLGSESTFAATTTVLADAAALDFDLAGIQAVIRTISHRMFYKSMTTYADARLWQDVYHVPIFGDDRLMLYIKFQADRVTEFRLMSFKER